MRYSDLFGKTEHDLPRDYKEKGQGFLLQGGMMSRIPDGSTAMLPLGVKAWERLKTLFCFSLDGLNLQRVKVPRAEEGKEGTRAKSFAGRAAAILRTHVSSYRDLPVMLGGKEEIIAGENSPLEGQEDRMMEVLFGFGKGKDQGRIVSSIKSSLSEKFSLLGLDTFRSFHSDGESKNNISDSVFLAVTERGNQNYFRCDECDYAALEELASSKLDVDLPPEEMKPVEKIHGPDIVSVKKLADFADIHLEKTTKTMVFETEETRRLIAVMVGGDREISEAKLRKVLGEDFYLAPPMTVREVIGTNPGYVGVVDLPEEVELMADLTAKDRTNFECGANEEDYHLLNVNFGRDVPRPDRFYDLRQVKEGEKCPCCGEGELRLSSAAEIAFLAPVEEETWEGSLDFTDAEGVQAPIKLWRLRVFLSRIFACMVENNWDEDGLIWPEVVAPYSVCLLSLGKGGEIGEKSRKLYRRLRNQNIDVLWDDRDCKAGVKFNDADLLGIPVRLVVGKKSIEKGAVEFKRRDEEEVSFLEEEEVIERVKGMRNYTS